jgi:hypothetical protein
VRFEVFTAVRMVMFFWVLAPCKLVDRCQRFGEIYSPEDGDSMFLRNVGIYRRVYTAPKPRRISPKFSVICGTETFITVFRRDHDLSVP